MADDGAVAKRLPGRPATRGETGVINTRVDARTVRALREEAAERGLSMARLIDQLVMYALPHRFDRDG